MKKWMLLFTVAAGMSFAGVKTYSFTLPDAAAIGGTQLKPGDYKVRLDQSRAVFLKGKKTVAAVPVKVDNVAKKYYETAVGLTNVKGAERLSEIELAGTRLKLEFPN